MSTFSWDVDSNTGGTGGGDKANFAKFPEGITKIRVIDEAPYQRWTHFMKKFKRSINCPGKGCPICEIRRAEKQNKMPYSHAMAKRFALNIINRETNRVEIMEQGKTFIQDLVDLMGDLREDGGKTLLDADIKVRRRGLGQDDTTYRLDIDSVSALSDIDKDLIDKKRIKLDEYFKPHTPEQILRLLNGEAWEDVMASNQEKPSDDEEPNTGNEEPIGEEEDIELA
jgi:hypothetical protein